MERGDLTHSPTIHLVYPHGDQISAPDSIGRELGRRLEHDYQVQYYDWNSPRTVSPNEGDVLIGHPHPRPNTCFRKSMKAPAWHRVIVLCPFNLDPFQVAFLDRVVPCVDAYLAITGPHWYERIPGSLFSHWLPKMTRIDMAVERQDYPFVKRRFNRAGHRRFVYIGHSGWQKNTAYLTDLAKCLPEVEISWIGSGSHEIAGLRSFGHLDFSTTTAHEIIAGFDFLLTVGLFDSNPTTILEAMSWGLIPVCTPQSGYLESNGLVNILADDLDEAAKTIERLNHLDDHCLKTMQRHNLQQIRHHYNWRRFAIQVIQAVESGESNFIERPSLRRRLKIRRHELVSPFSPLKSLWPRVFRKRSEREG